jgi:sulfite exporter TauE/SafE
MSPLLAAAFVLGAAGSGHCLLMCGPLVAATQPRTMSGAASLHLARVSVYACLGAMAGAGGATASATGVARWMAVAAGIVLTWQAVRALRPPAATGVIDKAIVGSILRISTWLRRHRMTGPVALGVVNGLLPCGLVYGALAGAVGVADPWLGAAMMAAFGLGTIPLLAGAAQPAAAWGRALAARSRLAGPVMLLVLAALVLLRSFNAAGAVHAH